MSDTVSTPSTDRLAIGMAEIGLRVCFAVRCFALGQVYLWSPLERDSDIFGLLFFDLHWPEQLALGIDNWGMAATCVIGMLSVLAPLVLWKSPWLARWRRIEVWLLVFVVLWELLLASSLTLRGGRFLSELTLFAHGLRIGVPLALLLTDRANTGQRLSAGALAVLRWATAFTFLAHGWKACQLSPEFVSMIIGGWPEQLGGELSQVTAEWMLRAFGITDLIVGGLLLTVRWQWVVLYMVVWGLVSAGGRTWGVSDANYPETLLRLVHTGGPLALFLEWRRLSKAQPDSSKPPASPT